MNREKVLRKLKRTYIKMLRHYAYGKRVKAHLLEEKAMRLEFDMKESRETLDRGTEKAVDRCPNTIDIEEQIEQDRGTD